MMGQVLKLFEFENSQKSSKEFDRIASILQEAEKSPSPF